jgi:hypothetical protein
MPADVKPFVMKRGYWMPDEAASVYAKAHTILSFECHSPIIAAANGTPMFYLRSPKTPSKARYIPIWALMTILTVHTDSK